MAGLISNMRNDIKKAGTNKAKIFYVREGQKARIRFLQDLDDGMEVKFHDSYERSINVPCQETFGRDCPFCEDDELRTRSMYAWSVYNYESNEVQLFMFAINSCSPLPSLMSMYDTYGTVTDRDYVISVNGKQKDKTYGVVPMDKQKFRNAKAKAFSEKQVLKILDKAFPNTNEDECEDDEEYTPKKSKKSAKKPKKEQDDWGETLPDDLEELSVRELYNLCIERDIVCATRQRKDYYVDLLVDWRADNEPQDDDYEESDDWGDDEENEPDYDSMSAKELYDLCVERDIEVEKRKPAKYYIKQLQDYDEANGDWGDDEEWEDE